MPRAAFTASVTASLRPGAIGVTSALGIAVGPIYQRGAPQNHNIYTIMWFFRAPARRPNKIMLLSLLPLDLMMYHRFISFWHAVQSRGGVNSIPDTVCASRPRRGIAGGTIYQRGARTKSRYYHYYHLISQYIIVLYALCMRFSPLKGVNLVINTVCKSRSSRRILSRLRTDLRENTDTTLRITWCDHPISGNHF